MVFGNAVHTQILVGIIYFVFVYPLHSSSTGHMIAIISTLLQLKKMIDEWHMNSNFYLNFFLKKHIHSTYEQTYKVEKKEHIFWV